MVYQRVPTTIDGHWVPHLPRPGQALPFELMPETPDSDVSGFAEADGSAVCNVSLTRFGGFLKWGYPQIIHFDEISIINLPFWIPPFMETTTLDHERMNECGFGMFQPRLKHHPSKLTYHIAAINSGISSLVLGCPPPFFIPTTRQPDWQS